MEDVGLRSIVSPVLPGLGRITLRFMPLAIASFGFVAFARLRSPSTAALACALIMIAVGLELAGWRRATQRDASRLSLAFLSGVSLCAIGLATFG